MKKILKLIAAIFIRIMYRVKNIDIDNVPAEGKAVLASNHLHKYDPLVFMTAIKREVRIMAKLDLWENKFIGWVLDKVEAIPVDRGKESVNRLKAARAAVKAIKYLNDGEIVGIFPEGTRDGREKGEDVQKGVVSIALKANAPIVPIRISKLKKFHRAYARYGKPFFLEEGIDPENGVEQVMNAIDSLELPTKKERKPQKTLIPKQVPKRTV